MLGLPPALNPMQVLWINVIMDGPPAQSLGVEPCEASVRLQPPRKRSEPVITDRMAYRVLSSALLVAGGTLWVFSLWGSLWPALVASCRRRWSEEAHGALLGFFLVLL